MPRLTMARRLRAETGGSRSREAAHFQIREAPTWNTHERPRSGAFKSARSRGLKTDGHEKENAHEVHRLRFQHGQRTDGLPLPRSKADRHGVLPNHRLAFYLHATVERSRARNARVPVAVWEIDEADEQRFDRYEGFPNYYVKLRRRVILADGSEIEGMVYVMILIRRQPPTAEYYRAIRDAYRQLGFRDEIVRVLEPALRRSRARGGFQIR